MNTTESTTKNTSASTSIHTVEDPETLFRLEKIKEEEKARANRFDQVKTVLVILSSRAIVIDVESLKQKIKLSYPEAKVYFESTKAYPLGEPAPEKLDLVIDFTGPGQRHKWFYAKKLKKRARYLVGRNAWFSRKKLYDRIYDEKNGGKDGQDEIPKDILKRERFVQTKVMELAGVPLSTRGDLGEDLGKKIALTLPGRK